MVAPGLAPACRKTLDVGLAIVTLGKAWWYRAYSRKQTPQKREQYEFAKAEAHGKGLGLWSDKRATAPWEWRKNSASRRKLHANESIQRLCQVAGQSQKGRK